MSHKYEVMDRTLNLLGIASVMLEDHPGLDEELQEQFGKVMWEIHSLYQMAGNKYFTEKDDE